jgi:hypothetical protein
MGGVAVEAMMIIITPNLFLHGTSCVELAYPFLEGPPYTSSRLQFTYPWFESVLVIGSEHFWIWDRHAVNLARPRLETMLVMTCCVVELFIYTLQQASRSVIEIWLQSIHPTIDSCQVLTQLIEITHGTFVSRGREIMQTAMEGNQYRH